MRSSPAPPSIRCLCTANPIGQAVQRTPTEPRLVRASAASSPNLIAAGASVGDCSLVRRFCSPKVRKSEIKGSSFRRFCSPKVRKSDNDFYRFLL